jgi:hypothetical protein
VTNSLKEAEENGNISILMKETTTAFPIDSVSIVNERNDRTVLTDSAGYATIQLGVALANDGTDDILRVADIVLGFDLSQRPQHRSLRIISVSPRARAPSISLCSPTIKTIL